jgi:hypothetical protein
MSIEPRVLQIQSDQSVPLKDFALIKPTKKPTKIRDKQRKKEAHRYERIDHAINFDALMATAPNITQSDQVFDQLMAEAPTVVKTPKSSSSKSDAMDFAA